MHHQPACDCVVSLPPHWRNEAPGCAQTSLTQQWQQQVRDSDSCFQALKSQAQGKALALLQRESTARFLLCST